MPDTYVKVDLKGFGVGIVVRCWRCNSIEAATSKCPRCGKQICDDCVYEHKFGCKGTTTTAIIRTASAAWFAEEVLGVKLTTLQREILNRVGNESPRDRPGHSHDRHRNRI